MLNHLASKLDIQLEQIPQQNDKQPTITENYPQQNLAIELLNSRIDQTLQQFTFFKKNLNKLAKVINNNELSESENDEAMDQEDFSTNY